MKEIKLKIEGMHCAGCSNRLEKILNNVDGVESAKVSLEEKSADIKEVIYPTITALPKEPKAHNNI